MYDIVTIFCILMTTALSVAADDDLGSGGLDRVLPLAAIGTPFAEFVAAHPDAVYSDKDIRDIAVSPERPGALLITHDDDPFLGLTAFANIGFRDGTLYEFVSVWTGAEEDVHARRRRFFTAVIQQHGADYARETILVSPQMPEERAAAVFLWRESDVATLAFYTEPSPIESQPQATLTYAQFTPDDPFLDDLFSRNPPDETQRATAWEAHADILPWLERLE